MRQAEHKNGLRFEELGAGEFEALAWLDPEAVIIDVRSPIEYHSGHLPGAVNLNVLDPYFREKVRQYDPDKAYYLYCRSGARSRQACLLMATLGFTKLYNLLGGVLTWNGPVACSDKNA